MLHRHHLRGEGHRTTRPSPASPGTRAGWTSKGTCPPKPAPTRPFTAPLLPRRPQEPVTPVTLQPRRLGPLKNKHPMKTLLTQKAPLESDVGVRCGRGAVLGEAHRSGPSPQRLCCTRGKGIRRGGGGGVGTRPWWFALLACGGAYWPLALEPSAMTTGGYWRYGWGWGPQGDGGRRATHYYHMHPQYANYWAPLTRKRHIPPHPAQPHHTKYWAPRTRKRHQQEHRPQRPTERSDPTQHAKGRTGDRPGPRKGATTRRNVTQGAARDPLLPHAYLGGGCVSGRMGV